MSQPFHYPRDKGFSSAVGHYKDFLRDAEAFMAKRGMTRDETQDALHDIIMAVEGPDSKFCEAFMGCLTPEEKRPVNSFTGEPW